MHLPADPLAQPKLGTAPKDSATATASATNDLWNLVSLMCLMERYSTGYLDRLSLVTEAFRGDPLMAVVMACTATMMVIRHYHKKEILASYDEDTTLALTFQISLDFAVDVGTWLWP